MKCVLLLVLKEIKQRKSSIKKTALRYLNTRLFNIENKSMVICYLFRQIRIILCIFYIYFETKIFFHAIAEIAFPIYLRNVNLTNLICFLYALIKTEFPIPLQTILLSL